MGWIATWSARLSPSRHRATALVRGYSGRVRIDAEQPEARLRRIAAACTEGILAGAELELFAWRRHSDCPAAACVLLAAVLARRGQTAMAIHVLPRRKRLHTRADALAAQTLITALSAANLNDTARQITHQLHHDLGHDTAIADWLRYMHMPGADTLEPLSDSVVEQLAGDLVGRLELIPTLVAAQRARPRDSDIDLLRSAIGRIARDVDDQSQSRILCQAMAELALLAGDNDDACRWAHRGLKANPFSAQLALVLSQVASNPAEGPHTLNVLQRACRANPTYPDLQRALILRYHDEGDDAAAHMQLRRWLEREPDSAIAGNLQREIAA